MRSRAALLPHPADPFLFNYWLSFYERVWHHEVDKLYVLVNSPIESSVIDYMERRAMQAPNVDFTYMNKQIEHGNAIDLLLTRCSEDYVMLCEDDGFIFKAGAVNTAFEYLDNDMADIVASPRGSCSTEIWDRAKELWGLDYSGTGDTGPNFWPNFFFTKREILLATDRNFGARAWMQGETIEPLNLIVEAERYVGDTFVNTSLQLRAKGYRIKEIPQYHGSPDDVEHFGDRKYLFDGQAPWVHVGSLSTGTHGVLMDNQGRALGRRLIDAPKPEGAVLGAHCNTDAEKKEWERRVAFWELFYESADREAIPSFRLLYRQAIDRVIEQYGLSQKRIETRKGMYHTLGL